MDDVSDEISSPVVDLRKIDLDESLEDTPVLCHMVQMLKDEALHPQSSAGFTSSR